MYKAAMDIGAQSHAYLETWRTSCYKFIQKLQYLICNVHDVRENSNTKDGFSILDDSDFRKCMKCGSSGCFTCLSKHRRCGLISRRVFF